MRVAIDARYIREKPSGIGAYVQALVDRVPAQRACGPFSPLDAPSRRASALDGAERRRGRRSSRTQFTADDSLAAPLRAVRRCGRVPRAAQPPAARRAVRDRGDGAGRDGDRSSRSARCRASSGSSRTATTRRRCGARCDDATQLIVTSAATADRVRAVAPGAASRLHVDPARAGCGVSSSRRSRRGAERAPRRSPDPARRSSSSSARTRASKRHADAMAAFAAGAPPPWRLVLLQRQGASAAARAARARPAHRGSHRLAAAQSITRTSWR